MFNNYKLRRLQGRELNVRRRCSFEKTIVNQNIEDSPIKIDHGKFNLDRQMFEIQKILKGSQLKTSLGNDMLLSDFQKGRSPIDTSSGLGTPSIIDKKQAS